MSTTDHDTVAAVQDLWLIGPDELIVPLSCELHYSRQDPYAVRMSLDVGTEAPVQWRFSRDLLAAALHGPEGIGDVRAWPAAVSEAAKALRAEPAREKVLNIELGPPEGCSRFEASAADVSVFLSQSYELVPAGQESDHLNFDDELTEVLSQA